jgi:hypothetical protein
VNLPFNICLALWISQVLCPRLGKRQPPPQVPDFIDDEDISQWTEYITTRPNTIEHLDRCLHK